MVLRKKVESSKEFFAGVAKLVKAHGLEPCGETLGGSSPPIRIIEEIASFEGSPRGVYPDAGGARRLPLACLFLKCAVFLR